ncbi:MAG: biotin transporter BioY [Clostridia bacterium]|nr:biotin transporter BioY [Clostridia bacterium]
MKKTNTQNIITVSLSAALICICSWIQVPSAVPFTMQTFAVFFVSATLGAKRGVTALLVYILLGAVGLPVFSGFQGGIGALLGATGGFVLGFVPAALIVGLVSSKLGIKSVPCILSCTASLLLCYLTGTLWFAFVYGDGNLAGAISVCVLPFIIPDIIKLTLAMLIAKRVRGVIR